MLPQHLPEEKAARRAKTDALAPGQAADPGKEAAPPGLAGLQQTVGNRAVQRLLQAKLTVGPANDQYEQEADRVAGQVMTMPAAQRAAEEDEPVQAKSLAATISRLVQRAAAPAEDEMQTRRLQRAAEDEEPVQGKRLQRAAEDEEPVQTMRLQRAAEDEEPAQTLRLQRAAEEEEPVQGKRLQRAAEDEEPAQTMRLQRAAEDEEPMQTMRLQRAAEDEEPVQGKRLQRAAEDEEPVQGKRLQRAAEDEEPMQAKPLVQRRGDGSFAAGQEVEQRLAARAGGGAPLPEATRTFMEDRFGADFSGVRVHTDTEAAQLSQDVSAQAFTHGNDIYFNSGKYDPGSGDGQHLLAHELTHTIQQGASAPAARRPADKDQA